MAAVIGRGINRGVGDRECLQSPMAPYLVVVLSLNAVAIMGGAVTQFDLHKGQQSNWYYTYSSYDRCDGWLFTNGIFGVLHILGALYIVRKIRDPEDAEIMQQSAFNYQVAPAMATAKDGSNPKRTRRPLGIWGDAAPIVVDAESVRPVPQAAPRSFPSEAAVISRNATRSVGAPESWQRVKHVLCENWAVAIYFLTFLAYLAWHYFLELRACSQGMYFCQRMANIFIVAGPASFVFSVITMMMDRRQL